MSTRLSAVTVSTSCGACSEKKVRRLPKASVVWLRAAGSGEIVSVCDRTVWVGVSTGERWTMCCARSTLPW